MEQKLAAGLHGENIALSDFNMHHKSWGGPKASIALIKKSEELFFVMQKWQIEQMVPVRMAIYKESTGESTMDLIFATPQFFESLIYYKIAEYFDNDLEY